MSPPRLLDLYSGEGGAAEGYRRAGWHVECVDIEPQPHNPFTFHRADALTFLAEHHGRYDAVHASPPCKGHNPLRHRTGGDYSDTAHLLHDTIDALTALGKPFVVENVEDADMPTTVLLCGSMFGLGSHDRDVRWRTLRRHRRFLTSSYVLSPPDQCSGRLIGGVYGTGGGGQMTRGYKFHPGEAAEAMGIDWMSRSGLSQAIPPAYTEFLGVALLADLEVAA